MGSRGTKGVGMKKLGDGELRMVEALLLAASKCRSAAEPARFTVFMLLMSQCEMSRSVDGELTGKVSFRRSTFEALRAVCGVVTGVDATELTNEQVFELHLNEAMRRRDEHLARLEAMVRAGKPKPARGRRGRSVEAVG